MARDPAIRAATASMLAAAAVDVHEHAGAADLLPDAAAALDGVVLAGPIRAVRADLGAALGRFPLVPVTVVASLSSNGVRKLVEAGAAGVVLESEAERTLAPTVAAAAAGQVVVPRRHQRHAVAPRSRIGRRRRWRCSRAGSPTARSRTGSSSPRARSRRHVGSIFGKLGVNSRSEAAALVLDPDAKLGVGLLELAR